MKNGRSESAERKKNVCKGPEVAENLAASGTEGSGMW